MKTNSETEISVNEQNMDELAVRILYDDTLIGTGILVCVKKTKQAAVCTTAHLFAERMEIGEVIKLEMEIAGKDSIPATSHTINGSFQRLSEESLKQDNYIILHPNYTGENIRNPDEAHKYDAAIIRVKWESWMDTIPEIKIAKPEKGKNHFGTGYPKSTEEMNSNMALMPISGKSGRNDGNYRYQFFVTLPSSGGFTRDQIMECFSGTALFEEKEGKLFYVGMISRGLGDEKSSNSILASNATLLKDIWEAAPFDNQETTVTEITDRDIAKLLQKDLQEHFYLSPEIKRTLLSCCKKSEKHQPLYTIEPCNAANDQRNNCLHYHYGKCWMNFIQKICLSDPVTSEDDIADDSAIANLVQYLCIEPDESASLGGIVQQIWNYIKNDKVDWNLRKNLLGSILLVQSKQDAHPKFLSRKQVSHIVPDITDSIPFLLFDEGEDIMEGPLVNKENNYAILHVKKLVEELSTCESLAEARNKIRKELENVNR